MGLLDWIALGVAAGMLAELAVPRLRVRSTRAAALAFTAALALVAGVIAVDGIRAEEAAGLAAGFAAGVLAQRGFWALRRRARAVAPERRAR